MKKKSYVLGILSSLIGPIGMFYFGAAAGLFWVAISLTLVMMGGPVVAVIIWGCCILAAPFMVLMHNRLAEDDQAMRDEILIAIREAEDRNGKTAV